MTFLFKFKHPLVLLSIAGLLIARLAGAHIAWKWVFVPFWGPLAIMVAVMLLMILQVFVVKPKND